MTGADYTVYPVFLANTPTQEESSLDSLDQAVGSIDFDVNANKTDCIFLRDAISILIGKHIKSIVYFTDLGSNTSSTETDINIHLTKVWKACDTLLVIWEPDLANRLKWDFFKVVVVPIL